MISWYAPAPRSTWSIVPITNPFGINAVDARRHDQVAGLHVGGAGHVLHPQRAVADAHHHALHARALDQRAGGGVAIDQQLHLRRAAARQDHAADDAGRRNHRHVGGEAFRRSLVDRHGAKIGTGRAGDHFRRRGIEVGALAQFEQLAQVVGALRLGALLLQPDLQGLRVRA